MRLTQAWRLALPTIFDPLQYLGSVRAFPSDVTWMLELDEGDQLLVRNPFVDDNLVGTSNDDHEALTTLALVSKYGPFRSQSVSPTYRCTTPTAQLAAVDDSECETRSGLTCPPRLDRSFSVATEEDRSTGSAREGPRGGSDNIIHPVGPNDSFAGVALRYGVSIATLRRANQLWPSDPIHLRTELVIPRGKTLRTRYRVPPHSASVTDAGMRSNSKSLPRSSSDLVLSSFVTARNMILSVLPARISLDALSSRASVSEDHELDDLRAARTHKMSADWPVASAEEGYELSILTISRAELASPAAALPSQVSFPSTDDQRMDSNHMLPIHDLRSRPMSLSPVASLKRPSRIQPFAALPVRTSQLEPQPAMEMPVRHSRI